MAEILKLAFQVGAQIQGIDQGSRAPHCDQIEFHAYGVEQRLSRIMQRASIAEATAEQPLEIDCPDCGKACRTNEMWS